MEVGEDWSLMSHLRNGGRPLVTNCMLMQKEMTYLWAETAMNRSQTDLTKRKGGVMVLLWIVRQAHCYALKHSMERDGENDEKPSESCLGGGWGLKPKDPTSNPESPGRVAGMACEWPWPAAGSRPASITFPSTTPFSAFSSLFEGLHRLISIWVTCTESVWVPLLFCYFDQGLGHLLHKVDHEETTEDPDFSERPTLRFSIFTKHGWENLALLIFLIRFSLCLWADPAVCCIVGRGWLRGACESRQW